MRADRFFEPFTGGRRMPQRHLWTPGRSFVAKMSDQHWKSAVSKISQRRVWATPRGLMAAPGGVSM